MSDELKPCPFCGGEAEEWEVCTYSVDSSYDMFGCRKCGIGFDTGRDIENETLWNTRADLPTPDPRVQALMEASSSLIADIRRRYPDEELRCPYMIAIDAALAAMEPDNE